MFAVDFFGGKRGPTMPTRTDGELLLRRSLEAPGDEALRLAYADFLDEQAMDRGEGIPCARARFVRMGYHPGWVPETPTELQFGWLADESAEAWFTGGAGCGKTTALLMAALRGAVDGEYRGLLLASSGAVLAETGGFLDRVGAWLGATGATWVSGAGHWKLPTGASVEFGSMGAWRRYLGAEYHFVGVDDVRGVDWNTLDDLRYRARCRRGGVPRRVRMTLATF